MPPLSDELTEYLATGWSVAGFSTTFSEAGIIFYTVLVQKEGATVAITIGMNRTAEVWRAAVRLSGLG